MRVVHSIDMNPSSVQPGDCLVDIKGRMYLIVCVKSEPGGVKLMWFRGNCINEKVYST